MSGYDDLADTWRNLPRKDWGPVDRAEYRRHKERVREWEQSHKPLTGEPLIVPPTRSLPPNFGPLYGKPKRAAGDVDRVLGKLGIKTKRRRMSRPAYVDEPTRIVR